MDAQHRYPQLIIKGNCSQITSTKDLPVVSRAHIIPAKASEQVFGAKVSSYFIPTIKPSENQQNYLQASLLGHELIGKVQNTQQQFYDAYLMRDNDEVSVNVLKKIEEVIDWRKDRPWGNADGQFMSIKKFVDIQKALHDF